MVLVTCNRIGSPAAATRWISALGVICAIGTVIIGAGAVPVNKNGRNLVQDARFWQNIGENQLRRILDKVSDTGVVAARNVIIFVGDGMGMATVTAGRIYKGQQYGRTGEEEQLAFDEFPNIGLAKTYNVDKQVPDSAGTATALFTGVKTNYGVVSMDATTSLLGPRVVQSELDSILEWGIAAGKRTGLVTTTRVTHATPSALYAKTSDRGRECDARVPEHLKPGEPDIARQLVEQSPGRKLNVVLAGGASPMGVPDDGKWPKDVKKFNGSMEVSCVRADGRNLVQEWLDVEPVNSTFVRTTEELLRVDSQKIDRLMGLFSLSHMSYNLLRNKSPSGEPSLREMTLAALAVLERNTSNGFVLMVEGGRIDHAHHQNHAHLALDEFLEMEKAVEAAIGATDPSETLIIVTADHSHALTMNGYPERGTDILGFGNKPDWEPYETLTYANGPGFWTHRASDDQERNETATAQTWLRVEQMTKAQRSAPEYRHQAMNPLPDETHGGEDVPVYATGPGSHVVRGAFEQNYVAYVMSYASCMGPVASWNSRCNADGSIKSAASFRGVGPFTTVLSIAIVFLHRYC